MRYRILLSPLFATGALLAGCSAVPVDRSFDRVQLAAEDRNIARPEWPTTAQSRRRIDERVAEILAQPLDAERAVAIALVNNRELRAEYALVGFAEANLVEAGVLENPSFSAGVGFPDSPPSMTKLDFGLTLNLLQLLITPAREDIATVQLDADILSVAHAVLRTATETRLIFIDLQAAENMSAVLHEIATASEASYEFAQRVHDAGNLSDLALANERALSEQSRLEYARSRADITEKRERLNTHLGLWGAQTDWTIEDRLPEIPQQEPDLADLESLAIHQRLDLAAAAKRVEAVAKAAGLQRDWRYLLSAEVGASTERDTDGQWVFGPSISVQIPIFNQQQGQIARLESWLLASEAQLEGLAIGVRSDVRRLRDRLFAARYEAEQYRDTIIPLQERITALTQEQYNFMLADTFDLLAAKRGSIAAYRDYLDSIKRYWEIRARLEEAVGGRLPAVPPPNATNTPPAHNNTNADMPAMHDHGGH